MFHCAGWVAAVAKPLLILQSQKEAVGRQILFSVNERLLKHKCQQKLFFSLNEAELQLKTCALGYDESVSSSNIKIHGIAGIASFNMGVSRVLVSRCKPIVIFAFGENTEQVRVLF